MKGFILNVVFDLGGVVITWNADDFAAHVFTDKEDRKEALTHILDHNDWIEMDRGTLARDEAIVRGAKRSGLSESEVHRLMHAIPTYLKPIKESVQLVQELKDKGNNLFVLSNLHPESIAHLEKEYSFLEMFQGKVISCRINKVKPELEIYQFLITKYNLDVNNTVFIDDVEINVKAAANIGLNSIHFKNINQCRRELEVLGCFR